MRQILAALVVVFMTTSASARVLSFEIQPFAADFDVLLDGRANSGNFPNLRIESTGASVSGSFGEILELNEVITVTISDYAANATSLYEDFIFPTVFDPPLALSISSETVGFQNNVLLGGRNLFGRTYGVDMFTTFTSGISFDRQVRLEVDELGFIPGGVLDDNIVDARVIATTVSPLQQYLFSGSSPQVLTFDTSFRFQVNSIKTSAVPIPAAAWLFGTALVGLVGFGKRKSKAAV